MSDDLTPPESIVALARAFLECVRRGERPTLDEYADRYPGRAEEIRQWFPMLTEGVQAGAAEGNPHAGAADPDPMPRQLGDYRVLRRVGSGGMGVVYEAVRESLACHVALKVLRPALRADAVFIRRFHDEARAAAGLHHTNIVSVFDFGQHGGVAYYAMQFIRGQGLDRMIAEARRRGTPRTSADVTPGSVDESLAEMITEGLFTGQFPEGPGQRGAATTRTGGPSSGTDLGFTLAPEPVAAVGGEPGPPSRLGGCTPGKSYYLEAARIGRQVAEALAYAHARGVLHRDIKPSNILIDPRGNAWVTDFGLAKFEAGEPLTAPADVVGTLRYMGPERLEGRSIRAGDIYALGATLYELIALRPAFEGQEQVELMYRICERPPTPPRAIDPRVPLDLETIVLRALAKDPADRYESAAAMAEDLRLFGEDRPIVARPNAAAERAWRLCRRNPVVAGLTAAVALILVAAAVGSTLAAIRLDHAAETNRRLLVRRYVDEGARLLDAGDPIASLPWFAEALRRDHADPLRERTHRVRLAAVLRACPDLVQVWSHPGGVTHAAFDPGGRRVVTAGGDGSARVWDVETGARVAELAHRGPVRSAEFSPDGTLVVTASNDGTARVWDGRTWVLLATLDHRGGQVRHAAFDRAGARVVTAGTDGFVRIWEARSGTALRAEEFAGPVWHAAFDPAGRRVVAAADNGAARIWDVETGARATVLTHRGPVLHAEFSPDGTRVVTAGREHKARIWDAETGDCLAVLKHDGLVWHAAFSPDGRRVATASHDGYARVWNATDGRPVTTPLRHGAIALHVAFSPDGRWMVSSSDDKTARVWDAETGTLGATLVHAGPVQVTAFSPDGRVVVTGSDDGTARAWRLPLGAPDLSMPHGSPILKVAFGPDGTRAMTVGLDGVTRVWNTATGAATGTQFVHGAPVWDAAFDRAGRRVVTAGEDGIAHLWNAATGERLPYPLRHGDPIWSATFSPDGTRVLTAGGHVPMRLRLGPSDAIVQAKGPGVARVWDSATGRLLKTLPHAGAVIFAAFSRDGLQVLSASADGTARVWDAGTGATIAMYLHPPHVVHAAFDPGGRRVVTAGVDGTARVWDVATGRARATLGHGRSLSRAEFSPDGLHVLTTSDDGTARIWNAADGEPLTPTMAHRLPLWHAAFSPGGTRVVTVGDDMAARVWDAETGSPLTPPLAHGDIVRDATFDPTGSRVLTASADGVARIWNLRPDGRPIADLVRLAEVLSGHRLSDTGGLITVGVGRLERDWLASRRQTGAQVPNRPMPR